MLPENSTDDGKADIMKISYKILIFSNIPFIIISVFIMIYYVNKWRLMFRKRVIAVYKNKLKNVDSDPSILMKDRQLRILVFKFIFIIILIELSSNIFAASSGIVYGFIPIYDQRHIPQMNSCQINIEIDFQMQSFPKGLLAYFPTILNISLTQFLQPTVSLLLNVLRRAYLDYPYRTIIKRWMYIILIRGCILFLLLSYYQTVYIGMSILPIFYIVDFINYIKNSRNFYLLLKDRAAVARFHSSRKEYRNKALVLYQYGKTASYTALTFFVLTLLYSTFGLKSSIHGATRSLCFFTFGYSPLIVYTSAALTILNNVMKYLSVIVLCLDYLYQILISFAYCLVCIAIGLGVYSETKQINKINNTTTLMVTRYQEFH